MKIKLAAATIIIIAWASLLPLVAFTQEPAKKPLTATERKAARQKKAAEKHKREQEAVKWLKEEMNADDQMIGDLDSGVLAIEPHSGAWKFARFNGHITRTGIAQLQEQGCTTYFLSNEPKLVARGCIDWCTAQADFTGMTRAYFYSKDDGIEVMLSDKFSYSDYDEKPKTKADEEEDEEEEEADPR